MVTKGAKLYIYFNDGFFQVVKRWNYPIKLFSMDNILQMVKRWKLKGIRGQKFILLKIKWLYKIFTLFRKWTFWENKNSIDFQLVTPSFLKNGREGVPSGTDSIRIVGPENLEMFFLWDCFVGCGAFWVSAWGICRFCLEEVWGGLFWASLPFFCTFAMPICKQNWFRGAAGLDSGRCPAFFCFWLYKKPKYAKSVFRAGPDFLEVFFLKRCWISYFYDNSSRFHWLLFLTYHWFCIILRRNHKTMTHKHF